jgi:hypothetical protein
MKSSYSYFHLPANYKSGKTMILLAKRKDAPRSFHPQTYYFRAGRHWIGGGKGGGAILRAQGAILRAHQKKILARFHVFLKSLMLEKPISFLRKLVSFRALGCGLGRPGEGAVARRSRGKIDNIRCGGGWGDRLHVSTGRSKSNNPPGRNRGQHNNQT